MKQRNVSCMQTFTLQVHVANCIGSKCCEYVYFTSASSASPTDRTMTDVKMAYRMQGWYKNMFQGFQQTVEDLFPHPEPVPQPEPEREREQSVVHLCSLFSLFLDETNIYAAYMGLHVHVV